MRRRRLAPRLLGLMTFPLIAAAAAPGEPSRDDALVEIQPMHQLRLLGNSRAEGIAFSADGHTLFVQTHGRAVNLWEVIVYYWPEVLGGVTAVTCLLCSLAIWRIARRRRLPGEPHCRRCNYCLRGAGERCPECGGAADRPVIGKPTRRRVFPYALILCLAAVGYGSLWAAGVSRTGDLSAWLNWWSYDLTEWAKGKGIALNRWARTVDRVLEIDVKTGRTRGTLITRANSRRAGCGITLTPDGNALIMSLDRGDRLAMVSTGTGRVMRTIQRGEFTSKRTSRWQQIAGFDTEGRTAYVVMLNEPARKTELIAWDLRSGRSEVVFECDADVVDASSGVSVPLARRFYVIPGSDPVRFLELPSGMDMRPMVRPSDVFVRVSDAPEQVIATIRTALWSRSAPAFTADGNRVALITRGRGSTSPVMFDLHTGRRSSGWDNGEWVVSRNSNCTDPPPNRIIVQGRRRRPPHGGLLIGDLATTRWIGRCALPPEYGVIVLLTPWVSPDGRFLAAEASAVDATAGRYRNELLIYDLRSLENSIRGETGITKRRQRGRHRAASTRAAPPRRFRAST